MLPSAKHARYAGSSRHKVPELGVWVVACGPDCVRDEIWHGEHSRPGVKGESVLMEYTGATAKCLFSLHHSDVVASAGEVTSRR